MGRSASPESLARFATVDDVLALVREQGGRVTGSRRLLLHALFDAPRHWTAEELTEVVQAQAPDTSLSTIYRNLEEFEQMGVIVHAHLGHGPATYHLSSGAHSHFVCEKCNTAFEAPDELFKSLSKSAKAQFGFEIDPHHFAILGRCRNCQ
ncbi:MAG: Fur family transcriptional regulator [Acidimicrobiales bacterium]